MKGLARGLIGASKKHLYRIRTFLKHQGNDPLNKKNKAHLQILRFVEDSKEDFPEFYEQYHQDIKKKAEGGSKPLQRGTGIVQSSTGIVYFDCIKRLREEQTLENATEAVYASHEDFAKVNRMHIENAFKAVPDKSRWADAVEGMAKKFAGVSMTYPMVHLDNWLAGKPDSLKNFKSTLGD